MKIEPTVFVSINVDMLGPNHFDLWVGNNLCGTYTSREEAMALAQTYIKAEGEKIIVPSSKFEPKSW